jgi:hypothetical protein
VRVVHGSMLARGTNQGNDFGRHGRVGMAALVTEILLAICANLRSAGERVPCGADGNDEDREGAEEAAQAGRDTRRRTRATYVVHLQQIHGRQHIAFRMSLVLEPRNLVIASKDGSFGLCIALSLLVCMRQKR